MLGTPTQVQEVHARTERARQAAEHAARLAECALAESEQARRDAEAGQVVAEKALALAEAARQAAEAAREAAEQGRVAAELATREAQLAQRNLQNFLAMAAHDLRNPVAGVLGFAQLMARPGVSGATRDRALDSIQRSALQMNRMIQDLVDAGSVGAGAFRVSPAPMDLVSLVHQVADEQRAATDRHRIEVEAPDRLEGRWDAGRLAQVLTNQVANAVKYSPAGGEVTIRVCRQGDDATVSITDQGIGIRAEDLPLLFRPFSRLSGEAEFSGTGLGLYISQGIVAAHGGRISATSRGPGEGSTFTISLPLRGPAEAA